MMHIVTQEGQIRPHTSELEAQLSKSEIEYAVIDTSIFPDIEWEFISALNPDYVYTYMTTKSAERNSSKD